MSSCERQDTSATRKSRGIFEQLSKVKEAYTHHRCHNPLLQRAAVIQIAGLHGKAVVVIPPDNCHRTKKIFVGLYCAHLLHHRGYMNEGDALGKI